AAPIATVWDFAQDIRRWADLMPGMRECHVIDADNSRWVLKVGVGGLVRTVTVDVHVAQWDGPDHATFTYALQGDPVTGGGTYDAVATSPDETEIRLKVRVEGSGQLAPMWEAMGRPLLPQLARGFAEQLKQAIETTTGSPSGTPPPVSDNSRERGILAWLRRIWQAIFG
ncbi:MAG: SRPBCC family protein, partial [Novosphingobium sp.]